MKTKGVESESTHVSPLDRTRVIAVCLGILTIIAVGIVLEQTKAVFLPLIIAWLLSYILGPAVRFLNRHRVPTPLAVAFMLTILLWICYLAGIFLYSRIGAFAAAYPAYEQRLAGVIQSISDKWNYSFDPFAGIDWGEQVRNYVIKLSGSVFSFISNLVLIFIFLIFILLGKPYFGLKLKKALSGERATQVDRILSSIGTQIGRYLSVQFLISFATGFFVWLALTLIGVQFAVTWGALAFFLNFIPTVGSIVSSIPPILLALVQFYPSVWHAVITAAALLTVQMVFGNVISPKVMGDKLNLSPVVVLVSLVFWGWLWGIVGAILSVPIASAIKIVCENVEDLRPISILMGSGRGYAKKG